MSRDRASDPTTPPDVLAKLAEDTTLQSLVARNPNAPWPCLVELWCVHPEAFLDNPLLDLLLLEDPQIMARLPRDTALAILGVERLTPFHLDRFSRHRSNDVREALLRHPRASASLIERLARGFFAYELAASHPNTDPVFVEELARHDWASVRAVAVEHPALGVATVRELVEDENEEVRRKARARLAGVD